jgi:ABC-2 type transport system ATP-binding protein
MAVSITALRVVRGKREVLHDVDAYIEPGSVTGLVGPSGCGKTTLLRSVVGVQIVAGGSIEVLGLPAGSPELRNRIGYSTQAPAVYLDASVTDNLRYFATVLRAGHTHIKRVVDEVGLGPYERQLAGSLSGGQLSRLSLAVALLGEPEVLVLDEPTVGLDPVLREELWQMFFELRDRRQATVLISTHVMDEAERCEQLILMRDGRILAHDTPARLIEQTGAQNVERAFLTLVKEQEKQEVVSR